MKGQSFEKKYQWIGKVGLLTKSEYMRASNYDIVNGSNLCSSENAYWTNSTVCKDYNYLYKSYTYKLLSPFYERNNFVGDSRASTGRIDFNATNIFSSVRPVVFLKSGLQFYGKGTFENPFNIL